MRPLFTAARVAAVALAACAAAAHADGPRLAAASPPPVYVRECGSCHTAFAPGLLPASSWQRLMAGLDRHFGSDAAPGAADAKAIADWLAANAGRGAAPPEDRISRAGWFVREHRRIDARVWTHASVGSAANCGACHEGAERGDFDEHRLRVPKGLDARLARSLQD